jgi:hypothetical protein
MKQEGDPVDFRGLLHRDGSVIAAVSIDEFASPDKLYRKLGCKLAVGMPFKVLLLLYHYSKIWAYTVRATTVQQYLRAIFVLCNEAQVSRTIVPHCLEYCCSSGMHMCC